MFWLGVLGIGFAVVGIGLIIMSFSDDGGCGYAIGGIVLAIIGVSLFMSAFFGDDYTPTEEEIAQTREGYVEAYENTEELDSYDMSMRIELKKGLVGMSIEGLVSKDNDSYTGNVKINTPGQKYDCVFKHPWDEYGFWSCLMIDGDENNCLFMTFNMAKIGEGIVVDIDDEIIENGTVPSVGTIQFTLNADQAMDYYSNIIEYFREFSSDSVQIHDLEATGGKITVTLENNIIKTVKTTLNATSTAGDIICTLTATIT